MGKNIIINGKIVSHVIGDGMPQNCPEDAIWCRELGDLFWAGVKAGRLTKEDSEIKIENDEYEEEY